MSTRYLDPRNDLAFKKIFGSENHKRVPIDFLNAVFHLKGQEKIVSLEFLATVQTPEIAARKESIVDVLVQDQAGSKYIRLLSKFALLKKIGDFLHNLNQFLRTM